MKRAGGRGIIEVSIHFISDDGLLYSRQVLERREEDMAPGWATDIFDEVAEFGAQGNENLILILNRLCATRVS